MFPFFWQRILYAINFYSILVPIGISVESVSKYRDEANAATELFGALKSEMAHHLESQRNAALTRKWWTEGPTQPNEGQ